MRILRRPKFVEDLTEDRMDRGEGRAQRARIDLLLRPAPLKTRLRLDHAILHGLDAIAAGQRAP